MRPLDHKESTFCEIFPEIVSETDNRHAKLFKAPQVGGGVSVLLLSGKNRKQVCICAVNNKELLRKFRENAW